MLASLRGVQGNYIAMDSELHKDLDWFREFLMEFNGRSLIVDPTPTVSIEADCCLAGGGVLVLLCPEEY